MNTEQTLIAQSKGGGGDPSRAGVSAALTGALGWFRLSADRYGAEPGLWADNHMVRIFSEPGPTQTSGFSPLSAENRTCTPMIHKRCMANSFGHAPLSASIGSAAYLNPLYHIPGTSTPAKASVSGPDWMD